MVWPESSSLRLRNVPSHLGRRHTFIFLDLHLDVAIVARRSPVIQLEVQVAVLADKLGGLDLDVSQALPASFAEAKELFPTVIHCQATRFLAGQHLAHANG